MIQLLRESLVVTRGQVAFLIEDAEKNDVSEAVRHLSDDLGVSLFWFDRGSFRGIGSLEKIKILKARLGSWRGAGLNVVAEACPGWKSAIA